MSNEGYDFHFLFSDCEHEYIEDFELEPLPEMNACKQDDSVFADWPAVILVDDSLSNVGEDSDGIPFFRKLEAKLQVKDAANHSDYGDKVLSNTISSKGSKSVSSDEPVILTDEIISEDNFEKPVKTEAKITSIPKDVSAAINSAFISIFQKQIDVDDGNFTRCGPGRGRKNPYMKSSELTRSVNDYILGKVKEIIRNRRWIKRKDLMMTFYIRALKKLTYHLIENWSTKNLYKRNLMSQYIIGFTESWVAFMWAVDSEYVKSIHITDYVKSLVEYSVIYFSHDKCQALINALMLQDGADQTFLIKQLQFLKQRDVTTKRNFKDWIQNSAILRKIFEVALEAMKSDDEVANNILGKDLIARTKFLLSE